MGRSMIFIAFFSFLFVSSITSQEIPAIRASMVRVNKTVDYVRDAALSLQRLSMFRSRIYNTSMKLSSAPLKPSLGEYIMQLSIGTPGLTFWGIADTGSDLVWAQCLPCTKCSPQPNPYFDPSKSSTFKKIPCSSNLCNALRADQKKSCTATECGYFYSYADNADSNGYLGTDTIQLGTVSIPNLGIGCGTKNDGDYSNSSGMIGLGRGPLSLVTQISAQKFSYCLVSDSDLTKSSPLLFGSIAVLNGPGIQTTPLIINPLQKSFYYLNLVGISVGPTLLPIPAGTFALNLTTGSGGLIIDSGTTLTLLARTGYSLVKQEFISQLTKYQAISGSRYGLDLCFQYPKGTTIQVPQLVLHFQGAADMVPLFDNYIGFPDPAKNVFCVLLKPTTDISILGNIMQMNMQILYDLAGAKLSFRQADCTKV